MSEAKSEKVNEKLTKIPQNHFFIKCNTLFFVSLDYDTVKEAVAKRKLEDKILSIEQVQVCNCVQVFGLNRHNTTKDAIFHYFENPKNGGGGVCRVDLNENEGWALVFFEQPQGTCRSWGSTARIQLAVH